MKILLVDDHPIFRGGVELLLRNIDPSIEVLHAATCAEGISLALLFGDNYPVRFGDNYLDRLTDM